MKYYQGGASGPLDGLVLELGGNTTMERDISKGSHVVLIIGKLPSGKRYLDAINVAKNEVPPIALPEEGTTPASNGEEIKNQAIDTCAPACDVNALAKEIDTKKAAFEKLVDDVMQVEKESDLPESLQKLLQYDPVIEVSVTPCCKPMVDQFKQDIQSKKEAILKLTYSVYVVQAKGIAGGTITVKSSRQGDDGKVLEWENKYTYAGGKWRVTYGGNIFIEMGKGDSRWRSQAYFLEDLVNGSEIEYVLRRRVEDQPGLSYSIGALVHWQPNNDQSLNVSPSAGFAINTEEVQMLGGMSLIYKENLLLNIGAGMNYVTRLKPRYAEGHVFSDRPDLDDLTFDRLIISPYVGLSFRFSGKIFGDNTPEPD